MNKLIGQGKNLAAWSFCEHLVVVEFPHSTLRLYSSSAAVIWVLLSNRATLQEIVDAVADFYTVDQEQLQSDIGQLVSEWTALGWLKLEREKYQLTYDCLLPSAPVDETKRPARYLSPDLIPHRKYYLAQFSVPIAIEVAACHGTAPKAMFDRLCAAFDGFPQIDKAATAHLKILIEPDRLLLFENDVLSCVHEGHKEIIGHILFRLLKLGYPHAKLLASLHAAGLGFIESPDARHGIVLSGVSGTGKSTLAVGLAESGWSYLGDDIIGLSATNDILALPTAASLKSHSWELFSAYQKSLNKLPLIHYSDKTARFLPMNAHAAVDKKFLVKRWVFPTFKPNATLHLQRLTPIETLQRLIASGISLADNVTQSDVTAFLQLLSDTPSHYMIYSEISEAEKWLKNG